jgi:hypothetical protein
MQEVNVPIGKPRASPLLSLNTDKGTESAEVATSGECTTPQFDCVILAFLWFLVRALLVYTFRVSWTFIKIILTNGILSFSNTSYFSFLFRQPSLSCLSIFKHLFKKRESSCVDHKTVIFTYLSNRCLIRMKTSAMATDGSIISESIGT